MPKPDVVELMTTTMTAALYRIVRDRAEYGSVLASRTPECLQEDHLTTREEEGA